jgi:hypothetical protein
MPQKIARLATVDLLDKEEAIVFQVYRADSRHEGDFVEVSVPEAAIVEFLNRLEQTQ